MANGICKDLKNKNCSLKNKRQEIADDAELKCQECGAELIISNTLVLISYLFIVLLILGAGVYFYQQSDSEDTPIILEYKEPLETNSSNDEKTQNKALENEEKEETVIANEGIDNIPPKEPDILSDISKAFHSNSFSLKLKGEVDSRVFINNSDMGRIGEDGIINIPLDISRTKKFNIFLEDSSINKNRSNIVGFSIRKKDLDKRINESNVNFALVSNTRQEVSYLLDQVLKYSDSTSSIYSEDFIELEKPVYMQTTPVTIEQFKKFIDDAKYVPEGVAYEQPWNYKVYSPLEGEYYSEQYPVANVSLTDIKHYVSWYNKKTGNKHRLPTVKEWVMALNQYLQNNRSSRRQEVDVNAKNITQLHGNLYEFSSTRDFCSNGDVLLLGSLYSVNTNNHGKKICDKKFQKTITFRLVREIE